MIGTGGVLDGLIRLASGVLLLTGPFLSSTTGHRSTGLSHPPARGDRSLWSRPECATHAHHLVRPDSPHPRLPSRCCCEPPRLEQFHPFEKVSSFRYCHSSTVLCSLSLFLRLQRDLRRWSSGPRRGTGHAPGQPSHRSQETHR